MCNEDSDINVMVLLPGVWVPAVGRGQYGHVVKVH